MKNKLKWGIMGAGLIANDCVAPGIVRSCNSEIVAVYSRSIQKAEQFANKFNIPNSYDSKTAFLENPEIEVVYISTPNAHHYEDIITCAKYKKHIFCEKPMCINIEEAYRIKEVCELYNIKLGVAFMFPFHPLSAITKKWLKEGRIGDVILAKSNFIFQLPECEKVNPWRLKPELSGGGAVIEVGCHCIDILNFLLNKKVVSVNATLNQNRLQPPSESMGVLTLVYEDNTFGLVTVANDIPCAGGFGTNFELHGTNGSIIGLGNLSRFSTGELIYRDKSSKEEIIRLPKDVDYEVYSNEVESFSNHVLNNTPLYSNMNNGIDNLKIILSAYKSSELGQSVNLI